MPNKISSYNTTPKLYEALKKMEQTPNRLTVEEFEKYRPLFLEESKTTLSADEISDLSIEYMRRIDPYKEVEIVRGLEVVYTLPAILYPFLPLDPKKAELVDVSRNMNKTNIPKYKEEAFFSLVSGYLNSQVTEENLVKIKQSRARYRELIDGFSPPKVAKVSEEPTPDHFLDICDGYEE